MPYFKEFNSFFIHIPKNAGRSIEQAFLGSRDAPNKGRRSKLNRLFHFLSVATSSEYAKENLIGTLDYVLASQHLTYLELDLLGLLPTDDCAYFSIIRNPFDRAVSSVFHFQVDHSNPIRDPSEFERQLGAWLDRELTDHNLRAHRRPQSDFLINKDGQVIDAAFLRFESLQSDLKGRAERNCLQIPDLPWHGRSNRDRDYHELFTSHARKRIERE